MSAARAYDEAKQLAEQGTPEAKRAARKKYEEAGALYRASGHQQQAGFMLLFAGRVSYDLEEYRNAVIYCEQARSLFRTVGRPNMEAMALQIAAGSYNVLGDNERARELFLQELAIRQVSGDHQEQFNTLLNLGLVFRALGDREKAIDYYQEALPFAKEVPDRARKAHLYQSLGELHAELGRGDFAIGFLLITADIFESLGNTAEAGRLRRTWEQLRKDPTALRVKNERPPGNQSRLVVQVGHSSQVTAISFSPDGRYLLTGGQDGTARLWEVATGTEIRRFEADGALVEATALTPDGRYALTGGLALGVGVWNVQTGQRAGRLVGAHAEITSLAVSPDGRQLLVGNGKWAWLWDLTTGKQVRRLETSGPANSVAFSPDGRFVAASSGASVRHVVDYVAQSKIGDFVAMEASNGASVKDAQSVRQDATMPKSVSLPRPEVVVWEAKTGRPIWRFRARDLVLPRSIAYSADGRFVLVGGGDLKDSSTGKMVCVDCNARLLDSRTGREVRRFTAEKSESLITPGPVMEVAISPDKRFALTLNLDQTVRLWNLTTGKLERNINEYSDIFCATFSPDGEHIAIGTRSGAKLFAVTGEAKQRFTGRAYETSASLFSPRGQYIVTGNGHTSMKERIQTDSAVCLWDIASGKEARRLNITDFNLQQLAQSPDGRYLALADSTTTVLWDLASGKEVRRFEENRSINELLASLSYIVSIAISPDNRFVLTGVRSLRETDEANKANYAILWDVATGKEVRRFKQDKEVNSVAFSPNGSHVLVGTGGSLFDREGVLKWAGSETILLDIDNRQVKQRFPGTFAIFSPDGRYILTADEGKVAQLWETTSGQKARELVGHDMTISALAFSADGRFVLTGSQDHTARLWDVANGRQLKSFAGHGDAVKAVSFAPDGRTALTLAGDGFTYLWDIEAEQELCRLISFPDGTWVVVDKAGRFDTNNLEEIQGLHWMTPDDPMRPLALEVLMEPYYTWGLLPRAMSREKFSRVLPLSDLNRAQPRVQISDVTAEPDRPDEVAVTVEVEEGRYRFPKGGRGEVESGLYGLRLARDGQLVGQMPLTQASRKFTGPQSREEELSAWRLANQLEIKPGGKSKFTFHNIRLRQRPDNQPTEFTASAFNEDRIKSPTSLPFSYTPKPNPRTGRPRAYLITMGVSVGPDTNWDLWFAASGARAVASLLSEKLKQDYEVVSIPLLSDYKPGGAELDRDQATKENLRNVFTLLAGGKINDAEREKIPNAAQLRMAAPEDLMLVYISSHGYADPQGTLYLVPSNIGGTESVSAAHLDRCLDGKSDQSGCAQANNFIEGCISTEELTQWFRGVDAGEMVLILDSCHAGSVVGSEFKPGPWGRTGFGQLSNDKGLIILAATQAADVAKGTLSLNQSLLTYSLALVGGRNGKFNLKEWLAQSEKEVPALYKKYVPDLRDEGQTPVLLDLQKERPNYALRQVDRVR